MTKRRWIKRKDWIRVGVGPRQTVEMRKFCHENFLRDSWEKNRTRFYFRNVEDSILFCLSFDTKSKRVPGEYND